MILDWTAHVFLRQDGFWLDGLLNHQGDFVMYLGLREEVEIVSFVNHAIGSNISEHEREAILEGTCILMLNVK